MKRTELKRITPLRTLTAIKPSTKRMSQKRKDKPATASQVARWSIMRKLGCLACLINQQIGLKVTNMALEHQHLTDCGRRRGHSFTIELCRHHHQGDKFPMIEAGYTANALVYGPSFGKEKAVFIATYGTDDELLEFQNALLAAVEAA